MSVAGTRERISDEERRAKRQAVIDSQIRRAFSAAARIGRSLVCTPDFTDQHHRCVRSDCLCECHDGATS